MMGWGVLGGRWEGVRRVLASGEGWAWESDL